MIFITAPQKFGPKGGCYSPGDLGIHLSLPLKISIMANFTISQTGSVIIRVQKTMQQLVYRNPRATAKTYSIGALA